MRTKMKNKGFILVAMLLLVSVFVASASGEAWGGEITAKFQDGLGEDKEEIRDGLEDHDLGLIIGTEKAALSVDDCRIDLGESSLSVLGILMNLSREMPVLSDELKDKAGVSTTDIQPENNVYSSLFTESKYRRLSSEEMADILSCRAFRETVNGIADVESVTSAADYEGSITFFQAEEKYLIMLDFTAGGNDYLVTAENDGFSFSVSVFTDTNVTDWDDTRENILAGSSENGRGIKAFSMIFDEKTESENYLEIARYAEQNSSRLELSYYQSADDTESSEIEIVAVRNEKKALKLTATLEAVEADLSGAVMWESARDTLDPSVSQPLEKCLQVICGE